MAIYECPFPDNCLGGTSAGGASCLTGSFGALCELCENNYYLEGDSNTCEPCADATKGSNVMTLFIIAGVMGVLAIVVGSLAVYNAQRLSDYYMRNEERILQLSAKITALIVTMQIIVLVNQNHQDLEGAKLPEPYGKLLDSLSFLALDMVEFVPVSCWFGRVGHFETLMVWTVGPLSLIALVSILILVSKHEQQKMLRENTCFVVMLILPLISRAVLQTFRCVEFDNDDPYTNTKTVLFVDPAEDCDDESYESMRIYAIVMTIIWPVGVPIALVIWLARLSPHLDPPNVSEEDAIKQRKGDPSIVGSSIAFVAMFHRPRYWYYEVIFNLQRRLVLTCVVLVFTDNGTFICFVLGVSIITTVSEREMNPHLDPFVGAFVYLMQWQILLCILAMLLMDAQMTNAVGDMAIGLILMLVNIFMALVVFLDTRGDIVREAQEKAAMRAKMVRNSVIGRNLPAHVARRFTARVSLASSMFQKKRKEGEENDEDEWRQDDDGDNEEEEVVAAIEEEEEEEVVEEDDLYHGYDSQDSADDSIGQLMNPMFRAWGKPSGEAKGGDSAADEASADDASSIEMTTTKERGVAEAKSDDGNTGDSSKSEEGVEVVLEDVQVSALNADESSSESEEEVEVAPEDVQISALNAEESSSESEEVDIVLGDAELSVDGSAAAANKAVAGVSSETGSLSDHFEIEARLSSDEAPNDLSPEGAKLPVAVDAESSARAEEGSTKEESTRNDRGETPSASGEGSKKKTQDQHDERAQKVHFLKAEFFDSL